MIQIGEEPFDGPEGRRLNAAYFAELRARFPPGYDPDEGMPTLREDLTPPRGIFFVAREGDKLLACGAMKVLDEATGEVKHMYVVPAHRGRGLGAQILAAVEQHARTVGIGRLILDTRECLTEAIALYHRTGYEAIERYNDNVWATHFFGKRL